MKKILLASLAFGVLLTACKKDEEDDSEPVVEQKVQGCMDPMSLTYNVDAEEDDGSCEYLTELTASKRNAIIEDFTGVRCTFCPDGARKAQQFQDANPGRVVIFGVHGGQYATAAPGWPDMTTPFADALIRQSGVRGYPAGTVNRFLFEGAQYQVQQPGGLALSRGGWSVAGTDIFNMETPVNLGIKATYQEETGSIEIYVEGVYTAEETEANNLNVAILEDGVVGRQIDMGNDNPNYVHNHVLRDLVTGQWGEELAKPEVGERWVKKYSYKIPDSYVHPAGTKSSYENLKVAAFVSRGQVDVLNVVEVKVEKAMAENMEG